MNSVHTINLKSTPTSMNSLYTAYIHCYQGLVGMNWKVFFLYKKLGKCFLLGSTDVFADHHTGSPRAEQRMSWCDLWLVSHSSQAVAQIGAQRHEAHVQQLLSSSANLTFPLRPAFLLSLLSPSVFFLLSSTSYLLKWVYAHLHFGIPLDCYEMCFKSLIFHVSRDCPVPSTI